MEDFLIISGLLFLNGVFAMCEIALVSSKKQKLNQLADKGVTGARMALNLLSQPEKFLSTVQIGITLIGILAGAYGGEAFTEDVEPFFKQYEWSREHAGKIAFTLIVAVITYFSLIIGELVPKTIALSNPEKISVMFAPFMKGLSVVTYPLVAFLSLSTKIFIHPFLKNKKEPPVTEDELKYMIETGSKYGVIEKRERDIIHSVFAFGDRKIGEIMTSPEAVVWLDVNGDQTSTLQTVFRTGYTKYPVCEDSFSKIIGVVAIGDILKASNEKSFDLKKYIKKPLFYPEHAPALKVLDAFRKETVQMGFVVDEYGSILGLITLHNLVDLIIGDLPIAGVNEINSTGSLILDGKVAIAELKRLLHLEKLPNEEAYSSLGGFIMYQSRKIPKTGDRLKYREFYFEVISMDGKRVDKVQIKKEELEE